MRLKHSVASGGFLTLTRLVIESYEREEYLLFSGFDDTGASLDQETMEKLFGCSGQYWTAMQRSRPLCGNA